MSGKEKPGTYTYTPVASPMTKVSISSWEKSCRIFPDFRAYADYTLSAYASQNMMSAGTDRMLFEYSLFKRKLFKDGASGCTVPPFAFAVLVYTELINEPGGLLPEKVLEIMLDLFTSVRDSYTSACLGLMFRCITDYCLIHELDIPFPEDYQSTDGNPFASDAILHRFYTAYSSGGEDCKKYIPMFVPTVCGFDYTGSTAYTANSELYLRSMCDVFVAFIDRIKHTEGLACLIPEEQSISYPSFAGFAVNPENCVRINVTFRPYSKSHHICSTAYELVRYIDNTLRRGLGIKCKLPGVHLPPELRAVVQSIICGANPDMFVQKKRGRKPLDKSLIRPKPPSLRTLRQETADTQSRFMPPPPPKPVKIEVDLEKAHNLEKESWDITRLLGVEYNEAQVQDSADYILVSDDGTLPDESYTENVEDTLSEAWLDEWEELYHALTPNEAEFLTIMCKGGDTNAYAHSTGGLRNAYIAGINEKASGIIGDIIIENSQIIPDYAEDVENMLRQYGKEN